MQDQTSNLQRCKSEPTADAINLNQRLIQDQLDQVLVLKNVSGDGFDLQSLLWMDL